MPSRKPLVLVDGLVRQLPPGDTLDAASSEVDVISLTNAGAAAAPIGSPVYISAANNFALARANAGATARPIGLVKDASIAASAAGFIQTDGVLEATTAEWDVITGQTGGLTAGAIYFLSAATAGRLTTTAPVASGDYCVRVGTAISTTGLEISIHPEILL
ncbi:hypothetical protein HNI00_07245 [Thermoleptolyngbya oregonensis NK1-22]|uniref:Uncharacterized protein n=1 Tax=Thermoleptolyngbya oregonensis NK1-22 TaxID=2547457 RepID=A0AA97BCQ7_9CYAN|nr:hypothetical protein [Thermoleptolyngbya oregonensis]WOB42971.1 hypothetical protein HNI00_07245 [Thermoleptolyngbya oregonensis NK1-22]